MNEEQLSECHRLALAVRAACIDAGLGYSPLEVAITWVRDAPDVTSSIIGARTAAQLRGVLMSESVTLPAVVRQALNEVSALDVQ